MLLAAQTIVMIGSSMGNKMAITWKETVTAYFTVLFQPTGTEENHKFRTASVPAKNYNAM